MQDQPNLSVAYLQSKIWTRFLETNNQQVLDEGTTPLHYSPTDRGRVAFNAERRPHAGQGCGWIGEKSMVAVPQGSRPRVGSSDSQEDDNWTRLPLLRWSEDFSYQLPRIAIPRDCR